MKTNYLAVIVCAVLYWLLGALWYGLLFNKQYSNWAGPVAMVVGVVVSVWRFSNQTEYVGLVPTHVPAVGDITFEAGFVITAVVYLTWHAITGRAGSRAPAAAVTPGR